MSVSRVTSFVHSRIKRFVQTAIAGAASAIALAAFAAVAHAAVSQVHLSWQNDPMTTMTVMWATSATHTPPTVEYGLTASYGATSTGTDTSHGVNLHTVELTGLSADTLYHYRVSDDGGAWGSDYTFRTGPAAGQTGTDGLVVTITGDKGTSANAVNVNTQMAAQNADLSLTVGDLIYSPLDSVTHTWFEQQQVYAQSSPLMPAWGNHETSTADPAYSAMRAHFAMPTSATSTERYFSYNVGNTHFLHVDSNTDDSTATSSPQYAFVQSDLAAASTNTNILWNVVLFHHNIYSPGGDHPDTETPTRANLQPLFDQYGVDVVFTGHNHYYSRSMPMANSIVIKDSQNSTSSPEAYVFNHSNHGQPYVLTGGGGQTKDPCPTPPYPTYIIRCDSTYSFAKMTIVDGLLTVQAINASGTLMDDGFTITKDPNLYKVRFAPTDDATVRQASSTTNYGSAVTTIVDANDAGGADEAYFKFTVSGITKPIAKAELMLTTATSTNTDSTSTGLAYVVADTSWAEGTINWNNRPSRNGTAITGNATSTIGKNATKVFDVTSVVTSTGSYSFAIASESANDVIYNSKEAFSLRPQLIISYVSSTDVTAPSVSITSPTASSTVGGTISITASASDDVAVAGVQFKVDGVNVGSEDPSAPYAVNLDTTTLSNGTHTLTAVARDGGWNQTTSAPVVVTVSNTILTFRAGNDAQVRGAASTTNYGALTTLTVDASDGGAQTESYLRFVATTTGSIVSARLKLTTSGTAGSNSASTGLPYTVADNTWTEGAITWKNRPARNGTAIPNNTATSIGLNTTKIFDVTSFVTASGTYSFAVASASTDNVVYNSDEAASNRPVLELTVTP